MLPALLALAMRQGGFALPPFPDAWYPVPVGNASAERNRLAAAPPGGFAGLGIALSTFPVEREIRLTVPLRAEEADEPAQINWFAYDADGKIVKRSSTAVKLETGGWVEGRTVILVPREARRLTLFVLNLGGKPVDVQPPTVTLGEAQPLDLKGGGLLRASAGVPVDGGAGTVLFPIPGPTAEQVPVSFVLRSGDPAALKGYSVRAREGGNWVCEARVQPNGKPTVLRWESLIAVRDRPAPKLPPARFAPAPPALKEWLASTPVVQAADPAIVKKAKALRAGAPDLETYVRRVLDFTATNEGIGKPFRSLDASCALVSGGSCTSRANLGAALLRAAGVPARTVAHLPTWAYGMGLYEHWLIEYWHPGVGWVRGETTQGEFAPLASGFAQLAVASIADERKTGAPGQVGWIMPGAAWMSGIQGTGDVALSTAGDSTANWCRPERRLDVAAVMAAARAAWPRLANGHPELDATAMKATPEDLTKALQAIKG